MLAKQKINECLDDAQIELQDELGVGVHEWTKLVAEVMEERSERYVLSLSTTQVIKTNLR